MSSRPVSFLPVPIDINYRCSVQRSDPHLQQMERISDISGRNRLRSGAIISSRLTSLCVFVLSPRGSPCGTERKSFLTSMGGYGRKTVPPLFSLHPPRPASLSSLFLTRLLLYASLRRSRVFSRMLGTIYHSVS